MVAAATPQGNRLVGQHHSEKQNGMNGGRNGKGLPEEEEEEEEGNPAEWTCDQVHQFLVQNGFNRYADEFADVHKIDGEVLLSLSEGDLRERPLAMPSLGDIKRLSTAITRLRMVAQASARNHQSLFRGQAMSTPTTRASAAASASTISANSCPPIMQGLISETREEILKLPDGSAVVESVSSFELHSVDFMTRDELIRQVESPDTQAKALFKLAIAFTYCLLSLLITAFAMVLVHDRVPDMKMYPPLPDIVLDNLPLIPWAFEMCELIGVVLSTIWFSILFFHKHRVVIARRMFSMVGTVFLLRCVTMMITSLSVPGVHLECRAKNHGSTWEKMVEAYHIWSHLGMSIQGVRSCGDYMFSGHTTAVTLLNHFITEYTPSSWTYLHTTTWVLNLFGVFFILAGHEHYSIDVFVAFYISSRMFLYYHTYAYNHANLTKMDDRMRLWFPLGWFFEAGSIGKVPHEFEFPFRIWRRRPRTATVAKDGAVGSVTDSDKSSQEHRAESHKDQKKEKKKKR